MTYDAWKLAAPTDSSWHDPSYQEWLAEQEIAEMDSPESWDASELDNMTEAQIVQYMADLKLDLERQINLLTQNIGRLEIMK